MGTGHLRNDQLLVEQADPLIAAGVAMSGAEDLESGESALQLLGVIDEVTAIAASHHRPVTEGGGGRCGRFPTIRGRDWSPAHLGAGTIAATSNGIIQ